LKHALTPWLAAATLLCAGAAGAAPAWPAAGSPFPRLPADEARIARIVAGMSLAQKVGQMTQPEIRHITPDEVRRFYIGSVLNGGGSWPGNNKYASVADWLRLAQAYHEASMQTDMAQPVPVIWGTDAVHGHNNVFGATLFPHNIGLGATRDAGLLREIGRATARAVRATGIQWTFAPTLAVVRDDRWGRTYESYAEDPAVVARLGGAYVRGLQDGLGSDAAILATAKHFIGDGGTAQGKDQGVNEASQAELLAIHAQGYYAALAAGAQTVMASFNSWHDRAAGQDYGKLHGSQALLSGVLKQQMGFDGFIVSDWNGIAQLPGCSNASCPQAINAGIDMVMVPEDWQAFIANTVAQVQRGEIPLARIDDAVTRILRVKLRAGLFGQAPQDGRYAGSAEALQARALARRAVRESMVLLKNDGGVLPLARQRRVLVVGRAADSLEQQTGGWTLSWQGTGNRNSDFPAGETVLAGLRAALGEARVVYSPDGAGVNPAEFDAVVAVLGETPYAEGNGDIPPSGTLRHSARHPEELRLLQGLAGRGRPVITVFLSGRPLYVNDLLNLSDAFVAAWLPGSEGGGIADLLLRRADGRVGHDFKGRLPFSWPRGACQTPLNAGDGGQPLFALGHGLSYARPARLGQLALDAPASGGCGARTEMAIFERVAQAPYELLAISPGQRWPTRKLSDDLNGTEEIPAGRPELLVSTVQVNTQQDAKLLRWQGPARLVAWSAQPALLSAYPDAALLFDLRLAQAPSGAVGLGMDCGAGCGGKFGQFDLRPLLRPLAVGDRLSLKIPLACFAALGVVLDRVEQPFVLSADAPFAAAIAHIRVQAGAARHADALRCEQLQPLLP